MSKSNTFSFDSLRAVLENLMPAGTAFAKLGSGFTLPSTAGSCYLSLHTADPGESGDQTTNEIAYTGYARVAIARADASWNTVLKVTSNAIALAFGQRTDNGAAVQALFWGIGTDSTGAGVLLYSGPLIVADPVVFVVDDSALNDTIVAPSHNFANGDKVISIKIASDTIPSGFTEGTVFFVINQVDDQFQISATAGGSAIALGNGAGLVAKVVPQSISELSTPNVAIGQLVITDD